MNLNPATTEISRHFQAFLSESGLSRVSVKNYVSDIRQFLIVSKISSARIITAKHIADYLEVIRSTKPEATYRRYLASIRRFITFLSIEYRLELPEVTGPVKTATTHRSTTNAHSISDNFKNYLAKENKTPATIKNYLSDLNHFLNWSANLPAIATQLRAGQPGDLTNILTSATLDHYFDHLKSSHTSTSVINRRESSLRKFVQFCLDAKLIIRNPFEKHLPLPGITLKPIQLSITKYFNVKQNPASLPFTPYLHLAILVLATTALGLFGYHQIFKNAAKEQAFPATPVRPSRQLAFQGHLADSSDNPISTSTSITFKLFNQATDGNSLYQTNPCQVTPDQDGIFSTLVGGGGCGPEIDPEVFSENASLFMEVTVSGQTLAPRQPIATAGYALNSETLQGYPASESATPNTVPVVDNKGQIGIGGISPAIVASSGNFALKGNALTLSTNVGTDGNITIAPDGRGKVNLNGGVDKGVFLHVNDANLTTGTLIEGYVGNNDPRGTLLHLASGTKMVNRLTVSTKGQTDIIAETYKNAAFSIKQTGTGPIFKALAGKTEIARLSTAGDLGLLGGLSLGSPYQTHAWPGQILTSINSRGMAGVIVNQNDSGPILAASSSGLTRFVIANNGNVGINTINPTQGSLVVVGRTWTDELTMAKNPVSGYVLTSDTGGNATWQPTGASDSWTHASPIVYLTTTTDQVGIGTTSPAGKFQIINEVGTTSAASVSATSSFAALVVDNSGTGELFTASSAGTTRFYITNPGNVVIPSLNTAGAVVYTNGSGQLNITAQGTSGFCLTSGGSGTPTWTSCSSASDNVWQRSSGVVIPLNITDDLVLGSLATASARIALINIAVGTPTASLSAGVAGATFLTATGTLATTNRQTLTLGDADTGNIILAPGGTTALTTVGNDVTIADDLTVAGADFVTTSTTFNLINTTATTLNLGGAATTFNIGPTGASGSIVLSGGSADTGCTLDGTTGNYTCSGNITGGTTGIQGYWQRADGSLTPTNITDSVNIGAIATASALVHLAGTSGENSFVNTGNLGIGDISPDAKLEVLAITEQLRLTYTDGTVDSRFTVDAAGDLTINNTGTQTIIADDLQVQGEDITTTATTFNFVAGATTAVNIGPGGTVASQINSAGGSTDTGCTVNGATGDFTCSGNITGGSSGSQGYWQRTTNSLAPTNIADSVNIGAVATASAFVHLAGTAGENSFVNTGNFGIGTITPTYLFTATSSKTDYLAQIYNTDTTSSSQGLQVRVDGTGNILNLNASGSDIVTVTSTQTTVNNPAQFTSPGDVSLAYDLVFTNPTASFIKSAAPLTVASGETFNNDNLTLQTYGVGGVVISPANTTTTTSGTSIALSVVPNLTSATNSLAHTIYGVQSVPVINESGTGVAVSNLYNLYSGLTTTAGTITNYYGNYIAAPTGAGTVTNTYALVTEATSGNVGIGTITPAGRLDITDTSNTAASLTLTNNTATTIGAGIDTLGVIDLQSTSLTTGNLVNVEANALTSGRIVNISSTSTGLTSGSLASIIASGDPGASWTGNLGLIEYTTSTDVDIDGSALKVGITGAGTGDGIALNVTTAQTGSSALAVRINDDGTYTDSTPFVIDATGNVGIGTISAGSALTVLRDANATTYQAELRNFDVTASALATAGIRFDLSTTTGGTTATAANIRAGKEATWTTTASTQDSFLAFDTILNGSTSEKMRLTSGGVINPGTDASQDIGTASTGEWRNINLDNAIQRGGTPVVNLATQTLGDQGVGVTGWKIEEQASISGTLGTTQLVVPGITFLGCTLATCNNGGSAVMVAGNFGDGKIDVGTVDPPYTINGEKYATYVPGMIGQNEEVAGHLATTDYIANLGYRYVIDFSNLPKASDLWLFSKVIDIRKHISEMTVMLTPSSPAKTWYEIDSNNLRLSIYSSKPTTISYRLTAPRFDSDKWTNVRTEGVRGFLIDTPDQPLNNLNSDTLVALDPVFTEQNINQYELKIGDNVITEIGSYAKLLVANLSAGFIRAEKLVSPIADIDTLTVNTLTAQEASISTVTADTATISGTLYVTDIKSPIIDDINSNYASASAILASIRAKYSDFDSLINPSKNNDPLSTDGLATTNATLSGELALYNQPLIITDTLLVNTSLVSNSLNSSEGTLYLQPTAAAPINLLAGLMTLTPDGKVNITGDLSVNGNIAANTLSVVEGLTSTTATISGSFTSNTASISGSLTSNEVITNGLLIASAASESATATSSAMLASNASIGTAIITAGSTEISISNSAVRPGTYVYLTPISDTGNQVLYLKSKEEGVGFTVSINQPLGADLKFNYWLIQTQP